MSNGQKLLVAGTDYPKNWSQFTDWFHSETECLAYLEKLRWPSGFTCPVCGTVDLPYRASRSRLVCQSCKHQTSVTAGTVFDKTRTPLKVWLAAAWYITNQKQGVSALGLQRVLGLGSYQTAWAMLHRFRRAMIIPDREMLGGEVEVDETFLSVRSKAASGRNRKSHTTKALVIIAVERLEPKGFGRIRLRQLPDDSTGQVISFVKNTVQPGSVVHTDGSASYRSLRELDYDQRRRVMTGSDMAAHVHMPGVHRVAALVQRWLIGTHHGAVKPEQLSHYLEEFVFRFNRRTSRSRGLLFYRLLEQAVVTSSVTYDSIVAKKNKAILPSVELTG